MAARQTGPGLPFDLEALTAVNRRGLEAFVTASRITAEGLQSCMRRQLELTQEIMGELGSGLGKPRGEGPADVADIMGQHVQQIHASFDRSLSGGREITEMLVACHRDAWTVLEDCCRTNLAELGGELQEAGAAASEKVAAEAEKAVKTAEEAPRRPARRAGSDAA